MTLKGIRVPHLENHKTPAPLVGELVSVAITPYTVCRRLDRKPIVLDYEVDGQFVTVGELDALVEHA